MSIPKNGASRVLLLLVLCGGIYLRVRGLSARPLWVDEAESSINALTILEHGIPVDHYLGLPIYENTLVEPWPGSGEYEFRDSSYSRGMAVYHGWLPLYAIAASLKAFGIAPDTAPAGLKVRHGASERRRRTWAPRVPAVIFGLIGLVALYFGGFALGGNEAAWAALIAGAFAASQIGIDQEARYYAATVALSTICCCTVWRMATRCAWRDVAWCAVSLTLLFYTHLLTFADHCVVLGLIACREVVWRRQPAGFLKFTALGALVSALTIPWLVATDFLSHRSVLPRAWTLLKLPADAFLYVVERKEYSALAVLSLVSIFLSWMVLRRRWPEKRAMLLASTGPITYLGIQLVVAYALFLYLMPAASLFWNRLTVSLAGPFFLLEAAILAALARAVIPRYAVAAASFLFLASLACGGRLTSGHLAAENSESWNDLNGTLEFLESQKLAAGTRLYSAPNDHLVFTYMTGLPVQSIAPVRKTFLDEYPGAIVLLDRTPAWEESGDPLEWRNLQERARNAGDNLTPDQATRLSALCFAHLYRQDLWQRAARVLPEVGDLPLYAREAASRQATIARRRMEQQDEGWNNAIPVYRGYKITRLYDNWPIFFYRFCDPASRTGPHANYAARMSTSTAVVIEGTSWVFFLSEASSRAGSQVESPVLVRGSFSLSRPW